MQTEANSSITIRKLPPEVKQALRLRAAQNGHSMEEEARQLLKEAVTSRVKKPQNAYEALRASLRGIDLPERFDLPPRDDLAPPPIDFGA